jgi:peptide deformylase
MLHLMEEANGIGLAATQVGVVRRLFVCRLGEEDEEVNRAFVNPVVVSTGDERESADEGCLSLQGILVPVERPARLTLEAQELSGEPVRLELEGLDARVVQHELDHLDGVLILDRTTDEARREALAKLRPDPVLTVRS